MRKEINLIDGNKEIIIVESAGCMSMTNISKGYMKDGELVKGINFAISDDMSFQGFEYREENNYLEFEEKNRLEFEFDYNDPLYFCLNRFLGKDELFVLDDDDTRRRMKKFMIIKRYDDTIKIEFVNKTKCCDYNKYNIFIKNIFDDYRSKIKNKETKKRLIKFLRDCEKNLLEEYHQITIDEYVECLRIEDIKNKQKTLIKK